MLAWGVDGPELKTTDHTPPQNIEAERSVLGCVLLQPACLDLVGVMLRADDFYDAKHKTLFGHFLAMNEAGALDLTLLLNRVKSHGDLEAVGGAAYLAEIMGSVATAPHAVYYAEIVADKARRRHVIETIATCLEAAYQDEREPLNEMLGKVESVLSGVGDGGDQGEPKQLADALVEVVVQADAILHKKHTAGLLTGLVEFDETIGGLFDGELVILAARPRVGKTALACEIARHVAGHGRLVYFASLEMADTELVTRMLCSEADVNSRRIRTGTLTVEDMTALAEASYVMAGAQLLIHDRPGLSVADVRRTCRRLRKKDLALVVVDYLQRITPADKKLKRYEQVAQIAKDLKTLARELSIPVICLAQLGRDAEKEARPQLHHLRESGDIEAEADVVAFLWRPAAWSDDELKAVRKGVLPPSEQASLIIEKNRNGETATLKLWWEAHRTRFQGYH